MTTPTKSPRRKSLANFDMNVSAATLVEHPVDHDPPQKPFQRNAGFAFSIGREGKTGSLSPGKMARRSAKPRKSILKGLPGYGNEDNTMDYSSTTTHVDTNHTIAFGDLAKRRESLARRVSFAANANVRMFDRRLEGGKEISAPKPKSALRHSLSAPSVSVVTHTASRRSSTHSRRASIQSLKSLAGQVQQVVGQSVDDAEMSMDMETEDEAGSEEEAETSGVDMGDRRISTGSAQSDEEGDEMDMDETGVYGAGILRRQSTASAMTTAFVDENDTSFASSTGTDEEKTMDFTVAIGGILPTLPPAHAKRGRQSIGYSQESPNSRENRLRPGEAIEGEADMSVDMDETVALGRIIDEGEESFSSGSDGHTAEHGRDRERTQTFSFGDVSAAAAAAVRVVSVDDDEDGMDMTVALGGIIDFPTTSPGSMSVGLSASTRLTRPSPGGSSYARPTVSSQQRSREPTPKKRNPFGPSPSPEKASTPRVDGMTTAGEVAKRLSFGSVTSSVGKKRPAEEEDEDDWVKRPRPTITQNIFAPAPTVETIEVETITSYQRRSASPVKRTVKLASPNEESSDVAPFKEALKPRQSLPRNLRPPRSPGKGLTQHNASFSAQSLASPARSIHVSQMGSSTPQSARHRAAGTPGKSPHVRRMMGEHVPQDEIDQANEDVMEMEPVMINLSDFLRMAKVEFMEDLPKAKRRSSTGRGLNKSYNGGDRQFGLGEYAEAEINSLFLTFYTWANRETAHDLEASRADLEELERARSMHNPMVIRHYLAATDEEKVLFEGTFKAFKTHTGLRAKERWYEWKHEIIERLRPDVENLLADMQEDAERLEEMESTASHLLPDLQGRLESLEKELEKERAAVEEVAECDQDHLAGLRIDIEEQDKHISQVKSELGDSKTKLDGLQVKLDELEGSKKVCEGRIAAAKSMCDQYTRSDVLRFKEEYDAIQSLHSWRIVTMTSSGVVLSYDQQVQLVVPCKEHSPNLAAARIEWIANPIKGKYTHGSEINQGLFALLQSAFTQIVKSSSTLVNLVQQTASAINASQRLRAEMGFLTMRLPTSYRTVDTPSGKGIIVTATILLRKLKSKVDVCFLITADTLLSWPGAIADVEVESRVVYGSADPEVMKRAAKETIMETSDEGYVGAFLQACLDAQGQHDK